MDARNATDPQQVARFREIRTQWRKQIEEGFFYAEGEQVLLRLLDSNLKIISMLITPQYFDQWKHLMIAREDSEQSIWIAEKKWMEESTGQKLNQGCLAIGQIPAANSLKELMEQKGGSETRVCFVALDGIAHGVNVGAIMRNCAAFGATAVLLDDRSVHPYCWRSIRTSLGSVFQVPVISANSLIELLNDLKRQQVVLIAADPSGDKSIMEVDFSKNCCLIFGNEQQGISKPILDLAPSRVAIPIQPKVNSLNVASASAIFLHHVSQNVT